jgi:uncharacterized tellurite resistance protein B-like protein
MFERLKDALSQRLAGVATIRDEDQVAAAAAMLMLEVAWADHDIAEIEVERTQAALTHLFGLTEEVAAAIVARARTLHGTSISMYPFTRTVNDALSPEEKKRLLRDCWRLANAEGGIDKHEEYTIRRIAGLLHIGHREFIDAKLAAKQDVREP